MFHPDFDDYGLGKERMAQMRKEVQHNRLEARLAKARLGEEAVPRRGGVLTRRTAFVAALAVEARVRVRALLLTVAARALVWTGPKGGTVYRSGGQRELRGLWGTVGLIDRLLHPDREQTSR